LISQKVIKLYLTLSDQDRRGESQILYLSQACVGCVTTDI